MLTTIRTALSDRIERRRARRECRQLVSDLLAARIPHEPGESCLCNGPCHILCLGEIQGPENDPYYTWTGACDPDLWDNLDDIDEATSEWSSLR